MDEREYPFKEGQQAEARSFLRGYRGAWFRCKIMKVRQRSYGSECTLQYYDFPDEKVRWTKLYQKPNKSKTRKLILRPCFPPFFFESQLPDIKTISEAVVIVNDVWKVGDLVDWWTDGCYWTGTIVEVLGNEKFRIELLPPPAGEGLSYEAFCKDFRPSLDWSPEHGWTVPIPAGGENLRASARLIKPINQVAGGPENLRVIDEQGTDLQATARALLANSVPPPHRFESTVKRTLSTIACKETQTPEIDIPEKAAKRPLSTTASKKTETPDTNRPEETTKSPLSSIASKETQKPEINKGLDIIDGGIGNTSCSDNVLSSSIRGAAAEEAGNTVGKDGHDNYGSSKKVQSDGSISLNSSRCDMIEAAILDLEELLNRVKWIKGILKQGMPLSNPAWPSWKYVEHRGSSMPK